MPYPVFSLTAISILIFVHLYAEKASTLPALAHRRFLSMSGGIPIAYVFVDLLPKLCRKNTIMTQAFSETLPYMERHAYIMTLAGFLLFFIVGRAHTTWQREQSFWLTLSSYTLLNFFVGYAVVDKDNPEVRPLILFTFAMSLLYFINDYNMNKAHAKQYHRFGKWLLIGGLIAGWLIGIWIQLPEAAVALISAFIGGGIIMNVMLHELTEDVPHSLGSFLIATITYAGILLAIGS